MIVIEFMDAVEVLFTALMAWIAAISAAVTLAGWGLVWVVTRVVKWAWQRIRPQARHGAQAPVSRPQGGSCGSGFTEEAPEASQAPSKDFSYREAA